jgi:CO/xanthine dehydrogenase Mo-binding subunit
VILVSDIIGQSMPRVDGLEKARGKTKFIADRSLPNLLHAYPVFSSFAHGRLTGTNTKSAESVNGYIDTFFAADVPGENRIGVILDDQPLFVHDKIRYNGDAVGIVVAETSEAAYRASKRVEVIAEELPPILSIDDSRHEQAALIHETNIACEHRVLNGDVDAGFAASSHIVTGSVKTGYQEHYYLEPQGCIVVPEDDGTITVYGSIQCVFYVQKAVSRNLGIPYSRVRVVQTPIGGAFGGKEDIPSEVCARTAVAAWKLNRPVKTIYRRADDMQATSKRHPSEISYKIGVDDSGKMLAGEVEIHINAGAYATLSSVVSYRASIQALGPYQVPNVRVHSTAWYTNLPPTGAFRGFGSPQATFGHERMMDKIARQIGMDPVEFRLQNVLKPGTSTTTGHRLETSVGAEETIEAATKLADWNTRIAENKLNSDSRFRYGLGISACHYGNCLGSPGWMMDGSGARIQVHRDGSVAVAYGLVDMGQGATTVVAQMTAEALGIDPERVTILQTDTNSVPDSGPAVASRNVIMTGNAIRAAADKIIDSLCKAAAHRIGCSVDQVSYGKGFARTEAESTEISFVELAELMYLLNLPMDALGWWHVPELDFDPQTGLGEAYFTYSYATHIAQVCVDTFTGNAKVTDIWAAHDVGRAINPAGIEGQVEGGVVQGIGWALYENFIMDKGKVVTENLSTYLLPTTMDSPNIETVCVENPEPLGPWGAKGIGEPSIIPTAAAVANAISNALGCDVDEIPVQPEDLLDLISHKESAGGLA